MATDNDIRGVQTPDPITLPDAAVLDGSASAAELVALLRSTLDAGHAAGVVSALQGQADATEVEPPPPTTYSVNRHVAKISPLQVGPPDVFTIAPTQAGKLIERVLVRWEAGTTALIGTDLFATLAVAPIGSKPAADAAVPSEWIAVDLGAVTPGSPIGSVLIFEPPTPYYVPAGHALMALTVASTTPAVNAQWADLP